MGRVRVYMKLNVMYMYLENTLNNLSNIKISLNYVKK